MAFSGRVAKSPVVASVHASRDSCLASSPCLILAYFSPGFEGVLLLFLLVFQFLYCNAYLVDVINAGALKTGVSLYVQEGTFGIAKKNE